MSGVIAFRPIAPSLSKGCFAFAAGEKKGGASTSSARTVGECKA